MVKKNKKSNKNKYTILLIAGFCTILISIYIVNFLINKNKTNPDILSASIISSACKIKNEEENNETVKVHIFCGKNVNKIMVDGSTIEKNTQENIDVYKYISKSKRYVNYKWITNTNISSDVKKHKIY